LHFFVSGQKYEFARKWKIHIVSPQWLADSIDIGYCQEEHKYRVEPLDGDPVSKTNNTSTPTKSSRASSGKYSLKYWNTRNDITPQLV